MQISDLKCSTTRWSAGGPPGWQLRIIWLTRANTPVVLFDGTCAYESPLKHTNTSYYVNWKPVTGNGTIFVAEQWMKHHHRPLEQKAICNVQGGPNVRLLLSFFWTLCNILRYINVYRYMWSVTSTPAISIGHSPTPKRPVQHRGLSPATLSNRPRWHGQHQTEPPVWISGLFALIRTAYR